MSDDIWKDIDIRITDQRIGMGVGGFDTIMRVEHRPSRIVIEIPNRFNGWSQYACREVAVDMIRWALAQGARHE